MAYKIALGVNWQGKPDFKANDRSRAKARRRRRRIDSIWVAEAWGRDAFTLV